QHEGDEGPRMTHAIARPRSVRRAAAALCFAAAALTTASAPAQQLGGFALDQLDPAPPGDAFFAVPSPGAPGRLTPRFGLLLEDAHDPLRLGKGAAVVGDQAFLHASASLALVDRLLLSVDMPVAVAQGGDDPTLGGVRLASPSGAAAGDLRWGARVRLFGGDRSPFELGVGSYVFLPTAQHDGLDGEGAVRVEPELVVGGRLGGSVGFVYAANAGAMVKTSDNPSLFTFGAAAGITLLDERLQVGPELFGATELGSGDPLQGPTVTVRASSHTNLELLIGAKLCVLGGLTFGAGAGPGLSGAIGTPTYRALALVAWAPPPARAASPSDRDGDGIPDAVDACPDQKGDDSDDPKQRGCPAPDRDGDGVPDHVDACPDQKGRKNADPTRNGCPADYDRDGIADAEDACPNQPGVRSADPTKNGCPGDVDTDLDGIPDRLDACPAVKGVASADPSRNGCPVAQSGDRDGDGIPDATDACPDERGLPSSDPKRNGCPALVAHTSDFAPVLFGFGSSTIPPGELPKLERTRAELAARPDVRVEVQGYADEVGSRDYNQQLSAERAAAVAAWLAEHGVRRDRMVTRGYGSTRPLDAPTAEERGRINRRVQIVITR
ncbi:MAG TPA: OmpA family protein, partial [Minicystis sp.]|nr:OmpA family protein [Minicystis sp.]